jgi:hypothetical protein
MRIPSPTERSEAIPIPGEPSASHPSAYPATPGIGPAPAAEAG